MLSLFTTVITCLLVSSSFASSTSSLTRNNHARRDLFGPLETGFTMKAHGGGVNSGKGGSPTLTVANGGDTIYTVDIVVAGKEFTVNLDTGSVDLWVYPNATKLQNVNSTTARASINYALGFASGQVAFAEVQLGSYRIPQQIFLNADQVKDMPDEVQGVLGLSLSRADIFDSFNKTYGTEAAEHYAGTPIDNIFAQRSDDRDFFDIQLGRTSDLDDIDDGRFMIGEHAPGYEQVESEPKVFRQTSTWWGVPIESLVVNGVTKPLPKSVRNGTLVAALDTGFSLPPLPPAMVDSIYSSMPGAVWVNASEPGTWIVPCNSTANVTLTIGGQNYPIHPLDLTRVATQSLPDLGTVTYCFGTFIHNTVDYGIDGILGDPFLRNVYISYNLGDKNQGGPYVQLLSTTNSDNAYAEFVEYRDLLLAFLPTELPPSMIAPGIIASSASSNTTNNSNSTDSGSNTTTSVASSSAIASPTAIVAVGAAASTESDDDTDGSVVSLAKHYGPLIIGLLAGNLLVGVLLLILVLVSIIKGAISKGGKSRNVGSNYAPVRFKDTEGDYAESKVLTTNYA